jgi:hypothetical protein
MALRQPDLIKDSRQPSKDLDDLFRDIHIELGDASVEAIVDVALERNLVPEFTLRSCAKRGLHEKCRIAISAETDEGLPRAKPISGGPKPLWKQISLFNCEQAIDLLQREAKAISSDIGKFRILEKLFRDRFGNEIPEFKFS